MVRSCSGVMMLLVLLSIGCLNSVSCHDPPKQVIFHNQFAVHIPGGTEAANKIAHKYGFTNTGQVRAGLDVIRAGMWA